jgi:hypothetical protein
MRLTIREIFGHGTDTGKNVGAGKLVSPLAPSHPFLL